MARKKTERTKELVYHLIVLLALFAAASFVFAFSSPPATSPESSPTAALPAPVPPRPIKVAFIGDQGLKPDSKSVLRLVRSEEAELLLVQGDFDYSNNPDAWDAQFNDILGPS